MVASQIALKADLELTLFLWIHHVLLASIQLLRTHIVDCCLHVTQESHGILDQIVDQFRILASQHIQVDGESIEALITQVNEQLEILGTLQVLLQEPLLISLTLYVVSCFVAHYV